MKLTDIANAKSRRAFDLIDKFKKKHALLLCDEMISEWEGSSAYPTEMTEMKVKYWTDIKAEINKF